MKLRIAWIKSGGARSGAIEELVAQYEKRIAAYSPLEMQELKSEDALLKVVEKTGAKLVALDSRGKQYSSDEFAEFLRNERDGGTKELMFAIGPADGFSDQ